MKNALIDTGFKVANVSRRSLFGATKGRMYAGYRQRTDRDIPVVVCTPK